jgi:hypothetical protein
LPRAREWAILPRMTRTLRAALAAAALFALALVVPSSEARAGESFDVAKELGYPGTRLLVVEFYSIDCKLGRAPTRAAAGGPAPHLMDDRVCRRLGGVHPAYDAT